MYDKEVLRNLGIGLSIFGAVIMVLFGIAEIESAVFIIPIGMLIGGIIMIFANLSDDKPNPNTSPSLQEIQRKNDERRLKELESNIKKGITNIIRGYMLELSDEDISNILSADNLESFYSRMASKIQPGTPKRAEFCFCMDEMLSSLIDEMSLTQEEIDIIWTVFLSVFMPTVTDESIAEIAKSFEEDLRPELHFLKGKINYELSCLGILMTIGIEEEDFHLQNEVNRIRRKNGYID